ncbi:MAG: MFS transporter [Rhodocyclaceae bacterium]|jgi:YNFM family putative membrane transporter|nr:MFS transporter [Rhodocyclaceae bacterium]
MSNGTELQPGTTAFRRANWALILGGFACFTLLYGTQPILPQFTAAFGISPTMASLAVSAGTLTLSILLIPLSLLSDRFGRAPLMKAALLGATVFAALSALAPDFEWLVWSRAGVGACIAALPAAAMAYLGEEIAPDARGRVMGMYIAGNALGGMFGRFLSALATQFSSWHYGLAALAIVGLICTILFWKMLPPAQHFQSRSMAPAVLWRDIIRIYKDPGLPWLFTTAFLIMGAFVSIYNYLGFRLSAAPYNLGPAAIGAIFLLYAVGSASSALAGHLVDRYGRSLIMRGMIAAMAIGVLSTLDNHLGVIVFGLALFTFGYFATHAIASGWVGARAGKRRGLVSALYLSSYYLGSSFLGSTSGPLWTHFAWPGMVAGLMLCVSLVFAVALYLATLERSGR